jgi:TRAP-type uncharacterized transport system substrate-binding protein
MAEPPVNPNVTRSRVVLEIASEMVGMSGNNFQAKVSMRALGERDWAHRFFGSNSIEGIEAVIAREADLAIINPACLLTLAHRGTGPFEGPQPVRAIAVIPSGDQCVFAVRGEMGLTTLEDVARKRPALRFSLRGQRDHSLHRMLDDIAAAAGFTLADVERWGGGAERKGSLPWPDSERFRSVVRGERNAIFDEGVSGWLNEALDAGMAVLPLAEATVRKLETMGYRRGVVRKADFPKLPADALSIDFSGWTIFVHADMPDRVATQVCAALDARKDRIPWEKEGPLPVERMCRDAPDTPLDVPLHPAAERFWRERGYLR